MAFDQKAYLAEKFVPRTTIVKAEVLGPWFEGSREFVVKGLSAQEIAAIESGIRKGEITKEMIGHQSCDRPKEQVENALKALGFDDDGVPEDVRRQIATADLAVIEPEGLDRSVWVKMAVTHPLVLKRIWISAMKMTGMGQEAKKKPGPSLTNRE